MDWLSDPNAWIGLLTLTALEVVLGIDNIVFISILAGKLPGPQQARARNLGLMAALVSRLALLFSITWIMRLETPLFSVPFVKQEITGRELILIVGGLFLIGKATWELHGKLEGVEGARVVATPPSLAAVIAQIMVVDIVFSIDSVVTAVGMVQHLPVMVAANVIALAVMLLAAGPISRFVDEHPTIKVLALAFLVLIGSNLFADGFGYHIPKGYTYFAMAFAVGVEMMNLRIRRKGEAVRLHSVGTAAGGPRAA